jgi:hypothetical protein
MLVKVYTGQSMMLSGAAVEDVYRGCELLRLVENALRRVVIGA